MLFSAAVTPWSALSGGCNAVGKYYQLRVGQGVQFTEKINSTAGYTALFSLTPSCSSLQVPLSGSTKAQESTIQLTNGSTQNKKYLLMHWFLHLLLVTPKHTPSNAPEANPAQQCIPQQSLFLTWNSINKADCLAGEVVRDHLAPRGDRLFLIHAY